MIFKMPHEDDLHEIEAKALKIYNDNMLWLNWIECPVTIPNHMMLDIMRIYEDLEGPVSSVRHFSEHLNMFFNITFNAFVHNNYSKRIENVREVWFDENECFLCFVGYVESYEEALRYLFAVDKVKRYYDH